MEHRILKGDDFFMAIEGGKRIYTVDDIMELPEDVHAELIDGEMFIMEAPTVTHQDIVGRLYMEIMLYIRDKGGKCRVILAPGVFIKKDKYNYVEPDIMVVCDRDKLDNKGCHGAPDWVVEVVSPSNKYMDYVRKLALYQSAGVREYWIVDSMKETVTVYDLEHKGGPDEYSFAEQVKVGIYEDLVIDFGELKESLIQF